MLRTSSPAGQRTKQPFNFRQLGPEFRQVARPAGQRTRSPFRQVARPAGQRTRSPELFRPAAQRVSSREPSKVYRRGKCACSFAQVTREDVANLANLLGIIAALMLAIALAAQLSLSTKDSIPMAFRPLLCYNLDFGKFVIETLEHEDIGKYEHELFNFTVSMGNGTVLDVRQQLLRDRAELIAGVQTSAGLHGCATGRNWTAAVVLAAEKFPMKKALAWMLYNGIHPNDYEESLAAVSVGVLTASVLWSVVIHVSLLLGVPAEDPAAFQRWLYIGWPALLLGHLVNLVGVCLSLAAHAISLGWNSPWHGATTASRNFMLIMIFAPCVSIATILSLMAGACACCRRNTPSG